MADIFELHPILRTYRRETYYDSINIPFSSLIVAGTEYPTLAKFEDVSSSTGVFSYTFAVDKNGFFQTELPHSYIEGTNIIPEIHWSYTGGTDGREVIWEMEHLISNLGEMDANSTVDTATVASATASDGTHIRTVFTEIDGSEFEIGSSILGRITEITNGSDEYDGTVSLFSVNFNFQKDTPGSKFSHTK